MTVQLYESTEPGASTLNGTAGSLITVLDAVLVNGFGTRPAAGWTKAFSAANKAAYLQGAGNSFYLRVDDTGGGAGGAREALVRGYETMSDVDTGTGLFPTAAQVTNGLVIRKSTSLDSTSRAWVVLADDRTAYILSQPADTAGFWYVFMFGDVYSYKTSDGFRTMIIGRATGNSGALSVETMPLTGTLLTTTSTGHYIARIYDGTGTSKQNSVHGDLNKSGGTGDFTEGGFVPYPNGPDGGTYLSPVWISESLASDNNHVRGELRGLWHFLHNPAAVVDGQTFTGTGELTGKTFRCFKDVGRSSTDNGVLVLETSDTWKTAA